MDAIAVKALTKVYANGLKALDAVHFNVKSGDFFALLGPNGAGKSTLIGVLCALVKKTSGHITVAGCDFDGDLAKAKQAMGLVPQEFNFNPFNKVENVLLTQAGYYGISERQARPRVAHYLKKLDLWEKRSAPAMQLSGGMKRRLLIARALVHEPSILILDEPTAGVDVQLRHSLWQFFTELNEQGVTIVLTTHYLEEAENLCRHAAIIDAGHIIAQGSMAELLQKLDVESFVLYLSAPLTRPIAVSGCQLRVIDPTTLEVTMDGAHNLSSIVLALNKEGVRIKTMRNKIGRLEELFLRLTAE